MNDEELDRLLADARPTPSHQAMLTAQRLARQTASGGRSRRRVQLLALCSVGVLGLAGAGSLAAHQLGIPPYQTIETGSHRATTPITFRNPDAPAGSGTGTCQLFLEWRGTTGEQDKALNAFIRDTQWGPLPDRLGLPTDASQSMVSAAVYEFAEGRIVAAIPEIKSRAHTEVKVAHLTGHATTCVGPEAPSDAPS